MATLATMETAFRGVLQREKRHTLHEQWQAEKTAMMEGWQLEHAELQGKLAAAEAKKMDALRVLQGVRTKHKMAERDLQRLRGTPGLGMSSHPS